MDIRWTGRCDLRVGLRWSGVYRDPWIAARARAVLGPGERRSLDRIRPRAAGRDYLAAHALARTMLARVVRRRPAGLEFGRSPRGRPKLLAPPGSPAVDFSLSHSDGLAMCAVSADCRVGADVESERNLGPDLLGIAETICSPGELEGLHALPPARRPPRFLALWTAREAVGKALGCGICVPPRCIRISIRGGFFGIREPGRMAERFGGWLRSWRISTHHAAAVAWVDRPPDPPGDGVELAGLDFARSRAGTRPGRLG